MGIELRHSDAKSKVTGGGGKNLCINRGINVCLKLELFRT